MSLGMFALTPKDPAFLWEAGICRRRARPGPCDVPIHVIQTQNVSVFGSSYLGGVFVGLRGEVEVTSLDWSGRTVCQQLQVAQNPTPKNSMLSDGHLGRTPD